MGGLYNALFGRNPFAEACLVMLDLQPDAVGRYRDAYVRKTDKGEVQIVIFTRNGGGNREEYEAVTEMLRAKEGYVTDFDDDFDCTYASYVFQVPEKYKGVATDMIEKQGPQMAPMEKFKKMLDDLAAGKTDDPQVQHALKVGEEILAPIVEDLKKSGG